jgi:tetratricopeptide (TPR) repeat protein
MKKLSILFSLLFCINTAFSQRESIDSMLQKIAGEKDDNIRIDLIYDLYSGTIETNPVLDMQIAQELLMQSQKNKDKVSEAMALLEIGYSNRAFGYTQKSLEYGFKALAIAQETGNEKLVAYSKMNLAHIYKDQADYSRAINLYRSAAESGFKLKDYVLQAWSVGNIGEVYFEMNKIDSALMYLQRDYEIYSNFRIVSDLGYVYENLGSIHGKLGNSSLAISYFNLAIQQGLTTKSSKLLSRAYNSKAQYFHDIMQNDSGAIFAKRAIAVIQNTAFSNFSIKPSKLLLDIYENSNSDSAIKYFKIYRAANDRVFNTQAIQQSQLLTIEDELRQQKVADEKVKAEAQRKQNLQYALIALSIIIFILLFLLLSRSFITNTRLIEFFGVLALLIVFEFLNLLLHPLLERVTNHTPVMMLLALVCIASLLIPLHRRVEKWSTAKLVEKNKKIRLANAKKTVEKLEGKAEA